MSLDLSPTIPLDAFFPSLVDGINIYRHLITDQIFQKSRIMGILIDKIRIDGFRGLTNFELSLSRVTVLTGMNNAGKTSVLKALQLFFGNRSFLSLDDLHINHGRRHSNILIDIRIVPIDENQCRVDQFEESWESVFLADNISFDEEGNPFVAVRCELKYNESKGEFERNYSKLNEWKKPGSNWKDINSVKYKGNFLDSLPYFYMEPQRDLIDDLKSRNSYIGKLISSASKNYSAAEIAEIEQQIQELNDKAIEKSEILTKLKDTLTTIESAFDKNKNIITISPFAKKIRDLNKSISVLYGDDDDALTIDYHGMGTRSWTSMLAFKTYVRHSYDEQMKGEDDNPIFPIIAIEEPEAHLHPNAQRTIFNQLNEMPGQIIIATHSPYIAQSSNLESLRVLYKSGKTSKIGQLPNDLEQIDKIKIKQKVISSCGEIIFAKAIVLFEGETEEVALPMFGEHIYNGCHPSQYGICFVGVGGYGSYLPFLKFAKYLGIPWYIFSDGEQNVIESVLEQINQLYDSNKKTLSEEPNIFVIPDNKDFENYELGIQYLEDLKQNQKNTLIVSSPQEKEAKHKGIDQHDISYYINYAEAHKTQYASIYAETIIKSGKPLPQLIIDLFEKIKNDLSL